MSVTKSFNKNLGIYYAYETTYEWDESRQKKVQKRKCIGKFKPGSDEIIPNSKVGRPVKQQNNSAEINLKSVELDKAFAKELIALRQKISIFEAKLEKIISLAEEAQSLRHEIDRIYKLIK